MHLLHFYHGHHLLCCLNGLSLKEIFWVFFTYLTLKVSQRKKCDLKTPPKGRGVSLFAEQLRARPSLC